MSGLSSRSVVCLFCAYLFARCLAGTGAAAGTVTGARGHSVSLPARITVTPDITEITWRRKSPRLKIAECSNGKINYFNTSYTGRVTLHRRNFSLEIRDLRGEDAGEYEVTFGTSSGKEIPAIVQLEVYDPVAGTQIKAENTTEICNFTLTCFVTSGGPINFTWWKEASGNDNTHHLEGHGKTIQVHHTAEVGDVVYRCEATNPVSEGTAQIRLRDICKQTTSDPGNGAWIIPLISVLVIVAVAIVASAIVIFFKRYSTRDGPADPGPTETVYAQVEQPQRRPDKQQPPEGNKTVQSEEERMGIIASVYDTINLPGTSGIRSPDAPGKSQHCEP